MSSKSNLTQGQIREFFHPGSYWLQRAEQCDLQGNMLRAAVLMRHGLEQEECGPKAELQYAWLLRRLGCIHASLRECLHVLSVHPSQFTAYGLMGLNLADLGLRKPAVDANMIYSQFVDMFPFAAAEWDDEMTDIDQWMYAFPDGEMRRARSGHKLKKAWKLLEEGEREEAEKLALSLEGSHYKPAQVRVLKACLTQDEETCRDLIRSLRGNVILRDPETLLRCAFAEGRFSRTRAARYLMKAACLISRPIHLGRLCALCHQLGVSFIAKAALKAALLDCPTRPDALFNLCVLALKEDDYAQARRLSYRLYLLDPEDPGVEKLWALTQSLGEIDPPNENLLRDISNQPFYAQRDRQLEASCRAWFKSWAEASGEDPLSRRKTRIRMQYLFGNVFSAPEAIAAIRCIMAKGYKNTAEALLRGYMLTGPGSWGLRQASRQLLLLAKPPFMAFEEDHFRLYQPLPMNKRRENFIQRRIYETLCILKKKLGSECIPYALAVMERLPKQYRSAFLGQERFVWVSAFCTQYALFRRRLMRPVDSLMLWPSRKPKWLKACRMIRKTLNGLEQYPRGKEPSDDETH